MITKCFRKKKKKIKVNSRQNGKDKKILQRKKERKKEKTDNR